MESKVKCPHSISRTCLAQEFGLVLLSVPFSVLLVQFLLFLNIMIRYIPQAAKIPKLHRILFDVLAAHAELICTILVQPVAVTPSICITEAMNRPLVFAATLIAVLQSQIPFILIFQLHV